VFLCTVLIVIILFYYIYKACLKQQQSKIVENYGKVESVLQPPSPRVWNSYTNNMTFSNGVYPSTNCSSCTSPSQKTPLYIPYQENNIQIFDTSQTTGYANLEVPFEDTISTNQRLVGAPNPRTLVRPIIPNPIYDFETWSPNDFVIPTSINDQKRQELYQNGYVMTHQYFPPTQQSHAQTRTQPLVRPQTQPQTQPQPVIEHYDLPMENAHRDTVYNHTNYNLPYRDYKDTACGNHPENLAYQLPINYPSTPQQRTLEMKEYNDNLFSIPIQPNIYTTSQINQPYASMYNLGISQDQPFLPTLPSYSAQTGELKFTEYDPSQVQQTPVTVSSTPPSYPLRNEIYDPRYTGYGTSYRHYIEPVTGQPRFYYDDVEQITQPNYITRNNLDVYGFASQVGNPMEPVMEGDVLKRQANDNYINNQLLYRTELQQRLMHKNNARAWQQRQAPISTMSRGFKSSNGTMSGYQ